MKFTVEALIFRRALETVSAAISGRSSVPILSHVKVETGKDCVILTGTDLDTTIRTTVAAQIAAAQIAANGAISIPAASLRDYVSRVGDVPLTLELEDARLKLRSASSRLTTMTSPAEDFPIVAEVTEGTEIKLKAPVLREMLHVTAFAASTEESRSQLMGVLFELKDRTLTLVATDTHRLALKRTTLSEPATAPVSLTIPAKFLIELERQLRVDGDVTLRFSPLQVQIESSEATFISRVVEGVFPNYEKVIPKTTLRTVTLARDELAGVVRRVEIVARNNSNKAICQFTAEETTVRAEAPDVGQSHETLASALQGEELAMAFNVKYLADALATMPAGATVRVRVELNGPLNPGIIYKDGDDSWLYVIMPMQI